MRGSRASSGIIVAVGLLLLAAPALGQSPWQYTVGYYNPQHWWQLGEADGGIAYDQTSTLNGFYRNGVTLGVGGAIPNDSATAAYFNGANAHVELGPSLNVTGNQISILAWVYPTITAGGDRVIIGKIDGNGGSLQQHYFSLMQRGSQAVFRIKAGGSTTEAVSTVGALATNQWSLVAGLYNGSSLSIIVVRAGTPYFGGVAKSGAINTSSSVAAAIGSTPVGTLPFQGRIDEVALYKRTFSAAEQNTFYSSLTANGVFYVRPDGNDANPGTGPAAFQAWRTIQKALNTPANVGPTDVIRVHPGTYAAPSGITVSGIAPQPIIVKAVTDGSVAGWSTGEVRILGSSSAHALAFETCSHIYWTGFDLAGHSSRSIIRLNSAQGITFDRCKIYGGYHGLEVISGSSVKLRNCLIWDNSASGIHCLAGNTTAVEHCTIVNNGGDGLYNASGSSSITNSIIAHNGDEGIQSTTGFSHTFNIVSGNTGNNFQGVVPHASEIIAEPSFVNATGNDFRLSFDSPAIDVAQPLSPRVNADIDNVARPQGNGPDIGCHEYADVGIWLFEEGAGTVTEDSSGNGNNGTLVNTAWMPSRCGYVLDFNGISSWVDLGRPKLRGGQYTVSAWFRTEAPEDQAVLAAAIPGTGDHQIVVQVNADGSIRYTHRDPPSTTGGSTLVSAGGYNDGQWHHVAAVKSSSQVLLYVDGQLTGQSADNSGTTEGLDFVVGKLSKSQDERYLQGQIDEIHILGSPLSIGSVRNLYGAQGHWRLDESSGSIAADSSPFGRDGQLYNAPTWRPDAGREAGALEFNGSDEYVEAIGSQDANFEKALTIMAWVRIGNPDENASLRIVSKKPQWNSSSGFELEYNPGENRLTFGGTGTNQLIAYEVDLNAGWHHLAVSLQPRDDGQVGGTFYVDGKPLQQAVVTVNSQTLKRIDTYDCCPLTARPYSDLDPLVPNASPVTIGKSASPGTGGFFHGLLDDVRFYNRSICDEEMLELYGAGPPRLRIKSWVEIP